MVKNPNIDVKDWAFWSDILINKMSVNKMTACLNANMLKHSQWKS